MKKLIIPAFLGFLLLASVSSALSAPNYPVASGSGFNVIFNAGESLAFQIDETLRLDVETGRLNGSLCSLDLWNRRGAFSFHANNDTTLKIWSPDTVEGFDITVSGCGTQTLGNFTVRANVADGNQVSISWNLRLWTMVNYTMLGVGVAGIFFLIFSPSWVVYKIRKSGMSAETMERIGYGMLLFLFGFGMLVIFLWS